MSFSFIRLGEEILTSRRGILRVGGLTLSGTAIAMLSSSSRSYSTTCASDISE